MKATKYIARRFDNVSAYETHIMNGKTQGAFLNAEVSLERGEGARKFAGTTTFDEANELLKYGDRELAANIERCGLASTRARLRANVQCIRTEASVVGFMPHVPNFVAGVPLTMINAQRAERPARALTLIYSCTTNSVVTTAEMVETASRVLSAVMTIEASGTRVNLYSACISVVHGAKVAAVVRVKSSDKKLNPVSCAYPLVHPSFLRRHFLRFIETEEGVPSRYAHNYGQAPRDARQELLDVARHANLGLQNAVIFGFYDARGKTTQEIIEMIKNGQ